MAAAIFSQSSSTCGSLGLGAGFKTQRITKKPIMSMTRSAKVKIHSGHSSHSPFLHFLQPLAMGIQFEFSHRWGTDGTQIRKKLYFISLRSLRLGGKNSFSTAKARRARRKDNFGFLS